MAWGNITGGRCGIQVEGKEDTEDNTSNHTEVVIPTILDPFKKNLSEEVIMMLKNQRVNKKIIEETRNGILNDNEVVVNSAA